MRSVRRRKPPHPRSIDSNTARARSMAAGSPAATCGDRPIPVPMYAGSTPTTTDSTRSVAGTASPLPGTRQPISLVARHRSRSSPNARIAW